MVMYFILHDVVCVFFQIDEDSVEDLGDQKRTT